MNDIQLASTDVLIEELRGRYDSMVFAGVRDTLKDEGVVIKRRFSGNLIECLGLCSSLSSCIIDTQKEELVELDNDNMKDV